MGGKEEGACDERRAMEKKKAVRRVSDDGRGWAQRAGSSAKALERPRQTYVTTLSEGESLLTAWYQRGGGGRVQASKISVSSLTISSPTLSARGKMRCNLSNRLAGIWSYLFCSFMS